MISGLYSRENSNDAPFTNETIRLDVDGVFPQMAASGTGTFGLQVRAHWVAKPLTKTTTPMGDEWSGPVTFRFGNTANIPHTTVTFTMPSTSTLRARFQGGGALDRVRDFVFKSAQFREVALEYDAEEGVGRALSYDTSSHPDRPAALALETLTLDTVFERAGFRITRTGADSTVPSTRSGSDRRWSSNEMHDAMQVHFSRIASLPASQRNRAQWALWTFFAKRFREDPGDPDGSTGGIMFDSIGAQRQGTAIFRNSFIAQAPSGDPAPAAWRNRMAFWTAAHEMGHSFNLLHAWQKELGTPWIPQPTGFHLMTFMNYPFLFQTGEQSDANTVRFFREFMFRFSDEELFFMRHAPERFVIMGGDSFGRNHAFEQANVSPAPSLALVLRANRDAMEFEFMEPVVIEAKLTNISSRPALLPQRVLSMRDNLTILVKRRRGDPEHYHPFAHFLHEPRTKVLGPGESMYESIFLSASGDGWLIDEPGYYTVQACLHLNNEDVLSEPIDIRVLPPKGREEEYLSQDYFSGDVSRVLAFDGSQVLTKANAVLSEIAAKLDGQSVAMHARVALDLPRAMPYQLMEVAGGSESKYRIREVSPDVKCVQGLTAALMDRKQAARAAQALGHIDYRFYAERVGELLAEQERVNDAIGVCELMKATLESRNVLPKVIADISASIQAMGGGAHTSSKQKKSSRSKK